MAKSQIIKDFANGVCSLEVVLKRALVIAYDLKNEKLIKWINNELFGYDDSKSLPEYRLLKGNLKLSYTSFRVQVTNQSVPSSILPENLRFASNFRCCDSIGSIEEFLKCSTSPVVSLSEFIPYLKIEHEFYGVTNFFLEVPNSCFSRVVDNVSKKIMELLLKIDSEVGNLDDLDISLPDKKQKELNDMININIESLINVGDGVNIKDSNISNGKIKNEK